MQKKWETQQYVLQALFEFETYQCLETGAINKLINQVKIKIGFRRKGSNTLLIAIMKK
jgi:hypothetical protein